MFKNKNWYKVLVPELVMVVVTIGVFFLCQYFGMEEKDAFAAAAVVAAFATAAFVAAFATTAAAFAVVVIVAFATAFATAAFAAAFATAATTVTVAAAFAVVAFVAIVAIATAKEYRLPMFWVVVSYVAEAAVIFLTFYFSS